MCRCLAVGCRPEIRPQTAAGREALVGSADNPGTKRPAAEPEGGCAARRPEPQADMNGGSAAGLSCVRPAGRLR